MTDGREGGGGSTNIMYHEIAENILNKKVMEVARQAQKKKSKKTMVHVPCILGNPNRKVILDILPFWKYDVSWRGGGGQPNMTK